MRKWDHTTRVDLLTAIACLKDGHRPEAARNLIEYFHERMQDDDGYDTEVLHLWMKHVFALIIEGKTADQAFGLKGIKGQYNRPDTFSRDMCAAASVVSRRRQKDDDSKEEAVSWESAVTDTALKMQLSSRTVERAHEAYRDGLEYLADEGLEQITKEYLPPP